MISNLKPYPAMKDSGACLRANTHRQIEWLGQVPEHWEVVQLRRHWSVVDCKHVTVPFAEQGYPLASVREVQSFALDLSSSKHTTRNWFEHLVESGRELRRGDLVYCRNVSVGACAQVLSDDEIAMGQDVCRIRSRSQSERFLNYLLHSPAMEQQLACLLIGSTFKRINVEDIKSLTVFVPPLEEQGEIADHLGLRTQESFPPIAAAEKQIHLIQEYRTRMIADVVTGKLDVREAAASLPDESEEAEAINGLLPELDELDLDEPAEVARDE